MLRNRAKACGNVRKKKSVRKSPVVWDRNSGRGSSAYGMEGAPQSSADVTDVSGGSTLSRVSGQWEGRPCDGATGRRGHSVHRFMPPLQKGEDTIMC